MDDPFFVAASNLDKLLDELEETETSHHKIKLENGKSSHHSSLGEPEKENLSVLGDVSNNLISTRKEVAEKPIVSDAEDAYSQIRIDKQPDSAENSIDSVGKEPGNQDLLIDFDSPPATCLNTGTDAVVVSHEATASLQGLDFFHSNSEKPQDMDTCSSNEVNSEAISDEVTLFSSSADLAQDFKDIDNNRSNVADEYSCPQQANNSPMESALGITNDNEGSQVQNVDDEIDEVGRNKTDDLQAEENETENYAERFTENNDAAATEDEIPPETCGNVATAYEVPIETKVREVIGFSEDVAVDEDEFNQFMQEDDVESCVSSSQDQPSTSTATTLHNEHTSTDVEIPHPKPLPKRKKILSPKKQLQETANERDSNIETSSTVMKTRSKFSSELTSSSLKDVSSLISEYFPDSDSDVDHDMPSETNRNLVGSSIATGNTSSAHHHPNNQFFGNYDYNSTVSTNYNSENNHFDSGFSSQSVSAASSQHYIQGDNDTLHHPVCAPPSYSSVIAEDNAMLHAADVDETGEIPPHPHPSNLPPSPGNLSVQDEMNEFSTEDNSSARSGPESLEVQPHQESLVEVVTRTEARPGTTKPHWVPDEETLNCTICHERFTFTRRRHHCRACGQIFCKTCCNQRSKLEYLNNVEARVCMFCYTAIIQADATPAAVTSQPPSDETTPSAESSQSAQPSHNQEEAANDRGGKSVRFSDGTRPDHPAVVPSTPPLPSRMGKNRGKGAEHFSQKLLPPLVINWSHAEGCTVREVESVDHVITMAQVSDHPPLIFALSANLFVLFRIIQYNQTPCYYFASSGLHSVGQSEIAFIFEIERELTKELLTHVFKLYIHAFTSSRKGKPIYAMDVVLASDFLDANVEMFGSGENAGLIFVRRVNQDSDQLQVDGEGATAVMTSQTVLFSATIFALVVYKNEVPWAKLFPARLLLGLGAAFTECPYPLYNKLSRAALYPQVGNTILGILCDFRNYKYKVISVPGLSVLITDSRVIIDIPCNRFSEVCKVMDSSNEHVLAFGANSFCSPELSNSNLACIQHPTTLAYRTETLKSPFYVDDQPTGASFIVFNASLNSGSSHKIKCTVVEDGIMIQLMPKTMASLKTSLRAMNDFYVNCDELNNMTSPLPSPVKELAHTFSDVTAQQSDVTSQQNDVTSQQSDVTTQQIDVTAQQSDVTTENESSPSKSSPSKLSPAEHSTANSRKQAYRSVEVRWGADDTSFNVGLCSPIDFQSLEGVVGYNVRGKSEKKGRNLLLRWNQVFFFKRSTDTMDMGRLAETVANVTSQALLPHLKTLTSQRQMKIGIRVSIHPDDVGYSVGSEGLPLPDLCMNALDDLLIPVVHETSSNLHPHDDPIIFELLYSILEMHPSWKQLDTAVVTSSSRDA